jgi:hypothetical protein
VGRWVDGLTDDIPYFFADVGDNNVTHKKSVFQSNCPADGATDDKSYCQSDGPTHDESDCQSFGPIHCESDDGSFFQAFGQSYGQPYGVYDARFVICS